MGSALHQGGVPAFFQNNQESIPLTVRSNRIADSLVCDGERRATRCSGNRLQTMQASVSGIFASTNFNGVPRSTMCKKILIVEDEADITELVRIHLEDFGAEIHLCNDGLLAMALLESQAFDLLVLDLNLPGLDGLEICRRIRRRDPFLPILMMTARVGEADLILGLEMGADDYLAKPFNVLELVARVRALFRRVDAMANSAPSPETIIIDHLSIDVEKRDILVGGRSVLLTGKEFELLLHFSRAPGRVYSREQLLQSIWGSSYDGYEHTVNSHVNRLRAKIEADPAQPHFIQTVWGVGYKFRDRTARRML